MLYESIESDNAEMSYCEMYIDDYETGISFGESLHTDYKNSSEVTRLYELLHSQISVRFLIERSLIFDNCIFFPDTTSSEDVFFTNIAVTKARKVSYVSKPLYHYVLNRPDSSCSSPKVDFVEQLKSVIQKTLLFYKQVDKKIKNIADITLFDYCMEHYIRFFYIKNIATEGHTEFISFINESFPNIQQNPMFNFHMRTQYLINLAEMYDMIRKGDCIFRKSPLIIFSASKGGNRILSFLRSHCIEPVYFCDNDKKKQGTMFNNIPVVSPADIAEKISSFVIIIGADMKFYKEIRVQLLEIGTPGENIYP